MSRWLASLLLALWLVLVGVEAALDVARRESVDALFAPALAIFVGVGWLVATRRPENPIGWLLLTVPVLFAISGISQALAIDGNGDLRPGPLARSALWVDNWVTQVWAGLVGVLIPLLFPDGRHLSPRWRVFFRLCVAVIALAALSTAFGSPTVGWGPDGSAANPFQLGGSLGGALEASTAAFTPPGVLIYLGALCAVLLRLRRSEGVERLQMKWFAFAMGLLIVGVVTAILGSLTGVDVISVPFWFLFLASLAFVLPLCIGVAILRHRLYDIDVVIRRALVYGGLTASLGAAYLGSVLLIGLAVGRSSDLAIAASTLAVAALFRPLRARIQALVDRRFFRRRYDAARTLEAFGGRLRDELDLEALGADLRQVVRETLQPAHVSLSLRAPEGWR